MLSGLLLCALMLLVAVMTRPAETALTDEPEGEGIELVEEGAVSLVTLATPPPDLSLIFEKDDSHPLPENGAVLPLGGTYTIGGTIYSNYPLDSVTVSITCSHNNKKPYPYKKTIHFKQQSTGVYTLTEGTNDEGVSLASLVDFSELLVGVHTLKISAAVKGTRSIELARCSFYVLGDEWETITKDKFPDSYPEALDFFGSEERFLYRYQWVNGRYVVADPEWEKTYITEIKGYPDGMPWLVHIDAVPYFLKAFEYLETTCVRVHGTNGDTGVIKAISLITEYNGCYVSRFTSSLKAISHHSFGTAVDVNATMEPNKNNEKNHAVIDNDVKDHLIYNGILTENGVSYYDFEYTGSHSNKYKGVPTTVINYLLYELAFYRAGFNWGYYYDHTCDAMHFGLSEFSANVHNTSPRSLRKVTSYIN